MTKKKTDEEKKGSKVIQWTPFPIPPKNLVDYTKIETASQKMTAAKIFPVNISYLIKIYYQLGSSSVCHFCRLSSKEGHCSYNI